ncbi:unnamed protein product [Bathycoccus prasinos]
MINGVEEVLILLFTAFGANWPVAKYTNGTVGLKNDGGVVQIQSTDLMVDGNVNVSGKFFVQDRDFAEYEDRVSTLETVLGFNSTSNSSIRVNSFNKEVVIDGHLNVSGTIFTQNQNISEILSELQSLTPPKCVPPGGDKLRFDGKKWICVCINSYYYGDECQYKTPYEPVIEYILNYGDELNSRPNGLYAAVHSCLSMAPIDGLCYKSPHGPMPEWNVSLVTNMAKLFSVDFNCKAEGMSNGQAGACWSWAQHNPDISKWDTSSVVTMKEMFKTRYYTSDFNQNISLWDTSSVTNMYGMFWGASKFNHYVGDWDDSKVSYSNYASIFSQATAFQAKYTCVSSSSYSVKPSSCKTVRSTWIAPPPPPSPPPPPPASPSPPPTSPPTGDCVSGYSESFASDGGTAMCMYAYGASYPSLCATNGAGENDEVCANTYTSGDFLWSHSCRVNGAWDEVCIANLCLSSELCTGYQKSVTGVTYWLQGGSGSQASYSNSNYKCCRENLP